MKITTTITNDERAKAYNMHIYDYHRTVPEGAIFLRSDATGQIYAMTCKPQFGGFTEVTREEYESYVKKHHLK